MSLDVDLPSAECNVFWETAMRCYVCHEVHRLDIYFCKGSHFLCDNCTKLKTCHCGKKITKMCATFLENIISKTSFWCQNNCGEILSNVQYSQHVKSDCSYRPISCVFNACQVEQKYVDYLVHLKRIHLIQPIELDDFGSATVVLTPETLTVQLVLYFERNYFIRWKKGCFWIQNYDFGFDDTGEVLVHLKIEGVENEQQLRPARLRELFKDVDHIKLDEAETHNISITFVEVQETE